MSRYDKAKESRERRLERRRLKTAAFAAGAAATIALVLTLILANHSFSRAAVIVEPLLALSLGAGLTLGARALDGPIHLAGRRPEAGSTSHSAATILLLLGCFCVIQVALLVVDLASRWNADSAACPAGAKDQLRVGVTLLDGTQRTISVTDCDFGKGKRDRNSPQQDVKQPPPVNTGAVDEESAGGGS